MADNKTIMEQFPPELLQQACNLSLKHGMIAGIVHLNELTQCGLKIAKEAITEYQDILERRTPITNALKAIHAISIKRGFPAEDIIGVKPHTNAPHGKWEYLLRESNEWIFIDLSNP